MAIINSRLRGLLASPDTFLLHIFTVERALFFNVSIVTTFKQASNYNVGSDSAT